MKILRRGKHAQRRSNNWLLTLPAVGALALAPVLIRPGDTLSGIAAAHHVPLSAIEAANPQVTNPDLIYAGQYLRLPGRWAGRVPPPPAPYKLAASGAPGSFQRCVITRESGGNPRAVNPASGAGGLYQFLPSTWAGLGYSGRPQDASVALQNQAFQRLYAQAGKQPWSPSDHCT